MTIGRIPGATGIQPTIVDAKGDIIAATAADSVTRLAVGANDTVLTADSSTATGLKWAAPASGGMTSIASGSLAASSTGFDLTSISGSYNELWLYINNYSVTSTGDLQLRTNNNTASDYTRNTQKTDTTIGGTTENRWLIDEGVSASQSGLSVIIRLPSYANSTAFKHIQWASTKLDNFLTNGMGFTRKVDAINRLTFTLTGAGTFDAGTYELFGVK